MLGHVSDQKRPGKKPATYQDVIDAPEHKVAEILDGELFLSPRPAPQHAHATMVLAGIFAPFLNAPQNSTEGWIILVEPEVHMGANVVVPDLGGWKRQRMPRLPKDAYFPLAPDWVCEVLSPSTEKIDRSRKLRIYAREGVPHLWFVNPVLRVLEVFRLTQAGFVETAVYTEDDVAHAEPFDAVEIELSRLWGEVETTTNGEA
jgi:Uma2 family endonuclease